VAISLRPPRNVSQRNLLAVYVGAFFASLGFSFVAPLMPLFTLELLHDDLAMVTLWVGLATGISPLLTAATGPWWGAIGDRVGQKRMIQRALVAIGLAIALNAAIDHPWQLVGLRAVMGALGGISVATLAAVTASSGRQLLGRNIGLLQAAQTFGQVAGPLIGGGLAVLAGMRQTFLISATLFGLAFGLVTWLYRDVAASARPAARPATAQRSGRLAGSPLFWVTLAVLFAANFVDSTFVVLLPLLLPALGAPSENLALLAGLGLSGGALAMAVSAMVAGRLSSRLPIAPLTLAMLVGAVLTLVAILSAVAWWQLLGLRVLLGLLAGGLPTLAYASAAEQVPAERRGAVVGLVSSAGLIGWAAAPLLVGLLASVDPRAAFAADLLLMTTCAGALVLVGGVREWRALPGLARSPLEPVTR
jgi:MFS transporter, DHA1 family, multidrug resistance protein